MTKKKIEEVTISEPTFYCVAGRVGHCSNDLYIIGTTNSEHIRLLNWKLSMDIHLSKEQVLFELFNDPTVKYIKKVEKIPN